MTVRRATARIVRIVEHDGAANAPPPGDLDDAVRHLRVIDTRWRPETSARWEPV